MSDICFQNEANIDVFSFLFRNYKNRPAGITRAGHGHDCHFNQDPHDRYDVTLSTETRLEWYYIILSYNTCIYTLSSLYIIHYKIITVLPMLKFLHHTMYIYTH